MSPQPHEGEGAVPFVDFMAHALHDPKRGYYARHIRGVGGRGDFATACTLFPEFGQAIAGWLNAERQAQPFIRHVIEIGAGDGSLFKAVRRACGFWRRHLWRWHIVESSPVLRKRQQALLGGSAVWHERLEDALVAARGEAFLFHNELLDAFPAHLLEWRDGSWQEVLIRPDGDEQLAPLTLPDVEFADFTVFDAWKPAEGQRCELHRSVRDWLNDWASHWRHGSMLTIDYGGPFPGLYHRRPRGTLRAYLLHQRLEGKEVYANPGRQDITADINFSDLRRWASRLGWRETDFVPLHNFLARHLPPHRRPAALLDPDGAGGAFQCLMVRATG